MLKDNQLYWHVYQLCRVYSNMLSFYVKCDIFGAVIFGNRAAYVMRVTIITMLTTMLTTTGKALT